MAFPDRLRRGRLNQDWLWRFLIERGTALPAKVVIGPELDEMAVIAANYFPGIYRG
ncbi:MAG TPA: hypothetical protein VKL40_13445 [Candidatus Angelobacter sp.]|nr:hypothetical protein [Candidatus Angelobacter sp.]